MARWTQADWDAVYNTLPGGEAFNGRYWWLTRLGTAQNPTGVTAAHDPTAATFGAVMEHDSQTVPGSRCGVQIIAGDRVPDIGFSGTNSIVVGGFRDPIVCPACGLTGAIRNKTWIAS